MKYKDIIELERKVKQDNDAATEADYKRVWNRLINAAWKHLNSKSLN